MTAGAQYDEVARIYSLVDEWLSTTRPARHPSALLDLVDHVAPPAGTVAADLGGYDGRWAELLEARFRCRVLPVDIAAVPLPMAQARGLSPVRADMQRLPFAAATLTLVWCRDALSMVPDPVSVVHEIARVLAAGGGAVIYTALTTPRLEPVERREFLAALDAPSWWGEGRVPIDEAVASAGLEVVHEERFSPEHQEAALREAAPEVLKDLVILARLHREHEALERLAPGPWTARVRAWSAWAPYLLLGKLETRAWVLRKGRR